MRRRMTLALAVGVLALVLAAGAALAATFNGTAGPTPFAARRRRT